MASPFPGMDPYIEDPEIWSDFHSNLATEIQGQLNPIIGPGYVARLTPRVTYEIVEIAKTQMVRPDVGVWQNPLSRQGHTASAVVIPPAPVTSSVTLEVPLRLINVEVRKTGTLELVTAIEILSSVNKQPSHDAYHDYQRKRKELLRSSAHLLEIDFLRGGQRPPLEEPVPLAPYYVVLSRVDLRPRVEVWPIQFRDKLPIVAVPLQEPDPDAPLDLAAALDAVYHRGGYASLIDYHRPPPPPKLTDAELVLVDALPRAEGVR